VIAVGARIKRPGEEIATEPTELKVVHKPRATRWTPTSGCSGTRWKGDRLLFARQDGVEAAWAIVEPILRQNTPLTRVRLRHVGTARVGGVDGRRRWMALLRAVGGSVTRAVG